MVIWSQEGLGGAVLLGSARPSLKVLFYYIKRLTVPIFSHLSVIIRDFQNSHLNCQNCDLLLSLLPISRYCKYYGPLGGLVF